MMSCFVSTSRLYSMLCLHFILILWTPVCSGHTSNMVIGMQFISFTNPDGTLKDGTTCCDDPTKTAGSCPLDLCDVAFQMCATRISSHPCDVIPKQTTPFTFNDNSFSMSSLIGNGVNTMRSLIVFKMEYNPGDINLELTAVDGPEENTTGSSKDVAGLTFTINWVDPVFNSSPHFRRFTLNDTNKQLVVDVASECYRHYYTDDCSVYCKPDTIHYTCLNNGTIQCLPGWEGANCMDMIDFCPGNICQNGATCLPLLLNYTCTCPADYTGYYCETSLLTTKAATAPATPATPATTAATAATTATTAATAVTTTGTTPGDVTTTEGGTTEAATGGSGGGGSDSGGGHGGNAELIAGSVVGSLLAVCLILVAGYLVRQKLKKGKVTDCTGIHEDRHGNANRDGNGCAKTATDSGHR